MDRHTKKEEKNNPLKNEVEVILETIYPDGSFSGFKHVNKYKKLPSQSSRENKTGRRSHRP